MHRDGYDVLERHRAQERIAHVQLELAAPRPKAELRNVSAAHLERLGQFMRDVVAGRARSSRIYLAQQNQIGAGERRTFEAVEDFAEVAAASGVEQYDSQPRASV